LPCRLVFGPHFCLGLFSGSGCCWQGRFSFLRCLRGGLVNEGRQQMQQQQQQHQKITSSEELHYDFIVVFWLLFVLFLL
jgi:hypothetical protein